MCRVIQFTPKEVKIQSINNPVLYAMHIIQKHGLPVNTESFIRADKHIGEGIFGVMPVTDISSLFNLCKMNGFCIVLDGTAEEVTAFVPGED